MKTLNIIVVFDEKRENVLMCLRRKNPYMGLLNFIGGHVEAGEESLDAAYRELWEETSVTKEDIELIPFMNMEYLTGGSRLEVFVGRLNKAVAVSGDENELVWVSASSDFSDLSRFAGDGNIAHIMRMAEKQLSV